MDPVLAAGEFGLKREEIHHLREGQRHHREIDALPPDRERADRETQNRRRGRAGQHREFGGEPPDFRRVRGDIARPAEIGRMAERQQPSEPEKQVERGREQRETHHLHREDRIDQKRQRDQPGEEHREDRLVQAGHPFGARVRGGVGKVLRERHQAVLPNSPSGLIISTIAMMTKITTDDPSG